jgi:hypothetical protein
MVTPVAPSTSNINDRLQCRRHLKAEEGGATAGTVAYRDGPSPCSRPSSLSRKSAAFSGRTCFGKLILPHRYRTVSSGQVPFDPGCPRGRSTWRDDGRPSRVFWTAARSRGKLANVRVERNRCLRWVKSDVSTFRR